MGKFEIYKDQAAQYRFRLKAPDGEIIATGEGYITKQSCLDGISAVRKYAPTAPVVDLTQPPFRS